MELAQIGPLTGALEALATAVGAGILLGSFVTGAARYLTGSARPVLEGHALTDGYCGGIASLWLVLVDILIRYG